MVLKTDKEKVKTLLSETIRLLCKNGLHFKSEFSVEALVGITLDKDEEFFLSIKEIVKNDIPPPKPEPKPRESRRSSIRQDVKGEPGDFRSEESPSATPTRKRPAESMDGNGDLPSLSLGDMQEGSSQFWPSVPTPAPDDDPGGDTQTPKKKRPEPNEDDSNSNVITIKGEPGSDSDDDVTYVEGNDQESNMGDNSMGDMSSSFMYGTPVSAEQTMLGNVPPGQIPWEQMQQFPMPGPSGMPTGPDGNHDNSQQMYYDSQLSLDVDDAGKKAGGRRRPLSKFEVVQRILLCKGSVVTTRAVILSINGRMKTSEVVTLMEELAARGAGDVQQFNKRICFFKKRVDDVTGILLEFGVQPEMYELRFNEDPNLVVVPKFIV